MLWLYIQGSAVSRTVKSLAVQVSTCHKADAPPLELCLWLSVTSACVCNPTHGFCRTHGSPAQLRHLRHTSTCYAGAFCWRRTTQLVNCPQHYELFQDIPPSPSPQDPGTDPEVLLPSPQGGVSVCITVTLLDGLVLARSVYNTDMRFRSVVALGTAHLVVSPGFGPAVTARTASRCMIVRMHRVWCSRLMLFCPQIRAYTRIDVS